MEKSLILGRSLRVVVLIGLTAASLVNSFVAPTCCSSGVRNGNFFEPPIRLLDDSLVLNETGGSNNKKKKRRRRKAPVSPSADLIPPEQDKKAPALSTNMDDEPVDLGTISDVANFNFNSNEGFSEDDMTGSSPSDITQSPEENGAIPLPDIKQALKKKAMEEELARIEEEKDEQRVRIKRTDKEAFAKLLEQQPYADADDSLFEEEEYGTISALLAERAKPFLGIPSGPLQVGHFIGALVIVLMAFIQYPGFPLTNLPSPLRGALQGGLGTIYLINAVLAGLSIFKAQERGQPAGLWVAKVFSVGGLAFDQLTQLPTLEAIEKAKARKGKRAPKNKRR